MNDQAKTLFSILEEVAASHARHAASQIRKIVSAQALTPEQHQGLEASLRSEMEGLIWSVLGRFDNVGCALPDGILGYTILARTHDPTKPDEYEALAEVDVREDEEDYADTWQDFLTVRSPSNPQR